MSEYWQCTLCTYNNPTEAAKCDMCSTVKPPSTVKPATHKKNERPANNDGEDEEEEVLEIDDGDDDSNEDEDPTAEQQQKAKAVNPFSSFGYQEEGGEDPNPSSYKRPYSALVSAAAPSISSPHFKKKASSGSSLPSAAAASAKGAKSSSAPSKNSTSAASSSSSLKSNGTLSKKSTSAASFSSANGNGTTNKKKKQKKECDPPEDFSIKPSFEQQITFQKWHGICAPTRRKYLAHHYGKRQIEIDNYRFQLLGAVILSARCQEVVVREAMHKLGDLPGGGFHIDNVASLEDPREISIHIDFVHINKVKSKYVWLAAKKIKGKFGGKVPVDEEGVLGLPGIGPTLAPLLLFLYRYQIEHPEVFDIGGGDEGDGGGGGGNGVWGGGGRKLGGGGGGVWGGGRGGGGDVGNGVWGGGGGGGDSVWGGGGRKLGGGEKEEITVIDD